MTLCTIETVSTKPTRRVGRPAGGKSYQALNKSREVSAKVRSTYRRSLDPCDNSNDSGIDFDHHMDPHHHTMGIADRVSWSGERTEAKKPKLDIKLENEEVNDNYSFPEGARSCKENLSLIRTAPASTVPSLSISNSPSTTSNRVVSRVMSLSAKQPSSGPVSLTAQLSHTSRYGDVSLTIVKQPEQQHRARYQTEGSRGAVKDRDGNGFPVVRLTGYYKPATLQVFIGTDVGKVSPHMFYQACKVSGKNSTSCIEKKIDGTCVIELQLDPAKDMSANCDCVGILKERNVDVEHRFPDQLGNRSKKKSTRCRMIFRTTVTLDNGTQETLQVCSQPIVCTQPPGVPEMCKKSLTSCPASGGLELFVLGKNFLKDTKVIFQQNDDGVIRWEQAVVPDKEYLQQTHFVCVVPPYRRPDITEPVSVRLCVVSSGKTSESHPFVYTPVNGAVPSVLVDPPASQPTPFFKSTFWQSSTSISKKEQDLDMMPPPETSMVPMASRRPSINLPSTSEMHSPPLHTFKQEYMDENSQGSLIEQERYRHLSESSLDVHHGDSNMSMINENSMMSHVNENSNISVGNEDSVDIMVRRNSLSQHSINNDDTVDVIMRSKSMNRSISTVCESSMECNSNISVVSEDTSCSTSLHPNIADNNMIKQHAGILSSTCPSATSIEKVIDLRMKMPMATVADLVNTTAPSMATLQRFGIVENATASLPTQSAQSVENYLNKIEAKPSLVPMSNPTGLLMKNDLSEKMTQFLGTEQDIYQTQKMPVINRQSCGLGNSNAHHTLLNLGSSSIGSEPVFLNSPRPLLSSSTQNDMVNIVAKSESAVVPENTISDQTNSLTPAITNLSNSLDRSVPTPINTEKLDALVNSTVESHLSPSRTNTSPKDVIMNNSISNMTLVTQSNPRTDVMLTSQDVLINPQNNLMVPPMINTRLNSPIMGSQEMSNSHQSSNVSSVVILNSQISPSLMCRNNSNLQQDTLLSTSGINMCPPTPVEMPTTLPNSQQNLLVATQESSLHSPISAALVHEPEKAVLLKAAVDLLETQKKISELGTTLPSVMTSATSSSIEQMQNADSFVQQQFTSSCSTMNPSMMEKEQKSDFILPIPVKDMANVGAQNDKTNEDRMMPQSLTSLTENELINLINPSCFDQGNNFQ